MERIGWWVSEVHVPLILIQDMPLLEENTGTDQRIHKAAIRFELHIALRKDGVHDVLPVRCDNSRGTRLPLPHSAILPVFGVPACKTPVDEDNFGVPENNVLRCDVAMGEENSCMNWERPHYFFPPFSLSIAELRESIAKVLVELPNISKLEFGWKGVEEATVIRTASD